MKSNNDNKAITVAPTPPRLPVLLLATKDTGDGWVAAPEHGHFRGHELTVLKRHSVRLVPAAALEQFVRSRDSFQAKFGAVPEDFARQLIFTINMALAARQNDVARVARLAKQQALSRRAIVALWNKLSAVLSPWDKVAATLNTGIFGAMPVLWNKGTQQLAPALLCQTPAQALFAHTLFRISGKHGLGICRRCGNPFFASRNEQVFCSYRCRVAEAMKRYRKNLTQRELEKSKSRKRARRTRR